MIRYKRVRSRRGGSEVTATILGPGPGDTFDVWFRATGTRLAAEPEAFAALGLPVAMRHGVGLQVPGKVTRGFLDGLDGWQRHFGAWLPGSLTSVTVTAKTRRPGARRPGVAAFFTGGVDSFYTALRHREDIDALVYVWGFDVALDGDPGLRADVAEGVHAAAAELGLPLVEIETNLKDWSNRHDAVWGTTYHAVALAAIAHLLAGEFGEVLMGSTYTYRDLFAWGSTPITDPLLGSDRMVLTHDGCEADRVERIALLADSPTAMRHLRVCWENRDARYNCGECTKCVRTMIALRICKALDRCETLPDLTMEAVHGLTHPMVAVVARLVELVDHLRRNGDDDELLEACEAVLAAQDPAGVRWDRDWEQVMPLLFGPPR
ncbi:MAG: hypothetical protein AAGK32_10810 [Actinomycetota bacterium]